jgi:16S rRNA G966 N2-methylase RsmD
MKDNVFFETNNAHLYQQDIFEALPLLESNSFDLCIVDPPYGASTKKNWSYGDKKKQEGFGGEWNPDRKQEQGEAKVVAVAEENKTQVAVNNEGKTNEATKHVKEPLKKEQIEPTEKQKKEVQKKKGRKI